MDTLFKSIVEIPSVSGREQQLREFLDHELENTVEEIKTDTLGNNIKRIGDGKLKVMLEAHADEVGFIITYIDKKGFAYFQPLGGIQKDILIGQKVKVTTSHGVIPGFIGRDSNKPIDNNSAVKDMWIDTGAGRNGANHIQIGDIAYFDTLYEELQNDCIIARGADNKVGVYAATQVVKNFAKNPNKNITLFSALTAQEELGMIGATVAIREVMPKFSFIIETTDATDTPNADIEGNGEIVVGNGPVITAGPKTDDTLFALCKEIAKKNKIPLQIIAQGETTSTDTDIIQASNVGTTTMLISIGVRYMHSPSVLFSWNDVENTIKLLDKVLQKIPT